MKISKGARLLKNSPHNAPWEGIVKSGTERLCAPMSGITLQSFNLVGHVIRKEKEKTELLTDGRDTGTIL